MGVFRPVAGRTGLVFECPFLDCAEIPLHDASCYSLTMFMPLCLITLLIIIMIFCVYLRALFLSLKCVSFLDFGQELRRKLSVVSSVRKAPKAHHDESFDRIVARVPFAFRSTERDAVCTLKNLKSFVNDVNGWESSATLEALACAKPDQSDERSDL